MGKFKVKTDKKTYNQVRSLLLESGFRISAPTGKDWVIGELGGIISSYSNWRDGPPEWFYTIKEVSLPEIRDMVVLNRNNVNDATHENSIYKYFKACDSWYYFDLGCTDKWQKSAGAKPEYYEKLKPIEKSMNTLKTEHHEQPTLNDQYAEIEQVRQAIKAPDGNDSDHAVDAMSYVFNELGVNQVHQHRHYFIDVSDVDEIDFYEIALRYNVTDPCIQHILKKCLAVGQRGQKDFHHDLKDIYDTAKRMLAVHGLDS